MNDTRLTILGQYLDEANALIINSEEEAWDLLEKLVNHKGVIPNDIAFSDWAEFGAYFKGKKYHSSLTPSVFPLYIELQKQINQTYAKLKYGKRNKKLSDAEYENLQIVIKVKKGSSNTSAPFDIAQILSGLANKMTPDQIFTLGIIIVLCWAGKSVYSQYVQNKANERLNNTKSEQDKEVLRHIEVLGEQDIQHMKIFAESLKNNPEAEEVLVVSQFE